MANYIAVDCGKFDTKVNAKLEGKDSKVVTNQYPSRAAAFKAACDAIKGVIAEAQG